MQILPANEGVNQALEILEQGGVIAHATETCYGLACDLSNLDAVHKLFAIKERPTDMPVSALFSSVEEAQEYVDWSDTAQAYADEHLPGPLTMIMPLRVDAPEILYVIPGGSSTIGVRVSSHPLAQQLVSAFEIPLSTTSANVSGLPSPYSADEIAQQFAEKDLQPDLILDSGALPQNPPSTIIDLTQGGKTLRG